jgi:hypothetical protein
VDGVCVLCELCNLFFGEKKRKKVNLRHLRCDLPCSPNLVLKNYCTCVMPKKIIKEFITKQLELMEIRLINNNISVVIIIVTMLFNGDVFM